MEERAEMINGTFTEDYTPLDLVEPINGQTILHTCKQKGLWTNYQDHK